MYLTITQVGAGASGIGHNIMDAMYLTIVEAGAGECVIGHQVPDYNGGRSRSMRRFGGKVYADEKKDGSRRA